MNRLKTALIEANISQPDKVLKVVEEVFCEGLLFLDDQSSVLSEKYDGASDLAHYYMGKGMSLRDIAEYMGVIVDWKPKHHREDIE